MKKRFSKTENRHEYVDTLSGEIFTFKSYGDTFDLLSGEIVILTPFGVRDAPILRGEKMAKKKENENREIEILQHNISYYYDKDQEMPESEQEHVKECIIDGCNQGKLCDGNENGGWWSIQNLTPEQKAAPELLEAAKDLVSHLLKMENGKWLNNRPGDMLIKAIAKAEGK